MTTLTIGTLKKLIEHIPEDYTVEYKNNNDSLCPLSDRVEIDISNNQLILK